MLIVAHRDYYILIHGLMLVGQKIPAETGLVDRKATEHGVVEIRQDPRESLDYSVRTYYTESGNC